MPLLCEICHKNEFKYKCPKCLKKTCSLACSKEHKKTDACDGIAHDPTKYIPHEKLKDADDEKHESNPLVQRDFNFLNSLKRTVELQKMDARTKNKRALMSSTNNHANKRTRFNNSNDESGCPKVIRRGVTCLLLPKGMQRSAQNRSKWDKSLDLFVWSIEWLLCPPKNRVVPLQEDVQEGVQKGVQEDFVQFVSHRIKETDSIVDGMSNVVYEKCSKLFNFPPLEKGVEMRGIDKLKVLEDHNIKFYTKIFPQEMTESMDSKKLILLEPSKKCIGELFRNRTVIEFPTIFVAQEETDLPLGYSIVEEPQLSADIELTPIEESNACLLYTSRCV